MECSFFPVVCLPFLLSGDGGGATRHPPCSPELPVAPEARKWEDPGLAEHLTSDGGGVQGDQWGIFRLLLWSSAWDAQASTGVLVIIVTVIKLKGLARVVLCLGGGAWASRKQRISWKGGGVSLLWGLRVWSRERAGSGEQLGVRERARGQFPETRLNPCPGQVALLCPEVPVGGLGL